MILRKFRNILVLLCGNQYHYSYITLSLTEGALNKVSRQMSHQGYYIPSVTNIKQLARSHLFAACHDSSHDG